MSDSGDIQITLIGAGSVEFTRILLADLVEFPELRDAKIALHDINPDRLQTAERIARYTVESTGAKLSVRTELDRRAALDGADFVINEIQVGGFEATLRDFEIPKKHGVRQTIGDTIGVGGVFRGLRTIPVLVEIATDVADVCPDAYLLNYTNPMAMLPWAVWEAVGLPKAIGLCHSVQNTHEQLAEIVDVPEAEIEFLTAGLNHQAFVLRFERAGESLYPLLDAAIERDPEGLGRRVRIELYRQFGFFPTESSEHSAEYVPWFMRHDDQLERYRIPVDEYIQRSLDNLDEYERIRASLAEGAGFAIEGEGELAPRYIHSLITGQPRLEYGNVRNEGLIDDLPAGCCVEVPCQIDGDGVHPIRIGRLPPQCAALNRTFVNVAELTMRAALEQRRDHVYQAVMLDPNAGATLTIDAIHAMVDELIDAHGELIPEGIRAGARITRS
ncbi:MAG TPA: alpha-glucosidase/alpha-galactosidase [Solirubrobacteraceae bacterium]|nr:alpha-glucosidase/alpha-galactosidase [Solirubrobacteraceae bacterium]